MMTPRGRPVNAARRLGAVGLATALFLMPRLSHAIGECYIPAYNTLVSNLNCRCALVGAAGFTCKDPAKGQTVTASDLSLMRDRIRSLMSQNFLMPVEWTASGTTNVAQSFAVGLRYTNGVLVKPSLMEGIGDSEGRFTRVPGRYVTGGKTLYAEAINNVPLMWIHFVELDKAIRSLTRTLATGTWETSDGSTRSVCGWGGNTTNYAVALQECMNSYGTPGGLMNGPHAFYRAVGRTQGFGYDLTLSRGKDACYINGLNPLYPRSVDFYLLGYPGATPPGDPYVFDANGDDISNQEWRRWRSQGVSSGTSVVSAVFGSLDRPHMGDCPADGTWYWLGYSADVRAVLTWQFPDKPIHQPPFTDPEEDGLVSLGCDCGDCPPEAKLGWEGGRPKGRIVIPLGITSGIGTAGLRIKAYMTEYVENGITNQMYSLFTGVPCTWEDATEGWGFVDVKRPSGADVLFATCGDEAGRAVDGKRKYRLVKNGNVVELCFPGNDDLGEIRHSMLLNYPRIWETLSVCSVRGTNRVYVTGNQYSWPGMTVSFPGDYPPQWRQIASVTSPGLVAVPTYSNGLIRNVEYRYTGLTNRVAHYCGSTGFRSFLNGVLVSDSRVTDPTNGTVEIWSGIATNVGLRVARKEIRQDVRDPETDALTVRQTDAVNEGTPQARSNVTLTAYADFPWGQDVVSVTEAVGTPAERVTTFGYGTDPADPKAWGRLAWERAADGGWTRYQYDASGRVKVQMTPFKSSGFHATNECRRIERLYGGDPALDALGFPATDVSAVNVDLPRAEIEYAAGYETARTYWNYTGDGMKVVRCAQAGARFDATDNLVTVTRYLTDGTYKGRPASVENPDNTRSVFSYSSAGGLTVTENTGTGPAGGSVTSGVRRVTVWDSTERVSEESSTDIATGTLISKTVNRRDGLGRLLSVSNAVTGAVTEYQQGCCGPEQTRDAEGLATFTVYDELKQVYATEQNGVTTYHVYDERGNAVETRQAAAGLPDIVRSNEFDAAGRPSRATDERGFTTTWSYATNQAGESIVTTCAPDGAVRVETAYLDGRTKCVTGTAVQAVFYDYGADADGTFTIEYRGTGTNAANWVKTCSDRLGRVTRIIHAGGYVQETRYDAVGRPVRQEDGYTAQLTEYNGRGEPEWRAADMNGNGVVDRAGPDRVARTVTGYATMEGRPARKTESSVCDQEGTGTVRVVSEQWQALDGRTTWSIAFGRTSRVDIARNRAAAAHTETNALPDGTRTVSCYTNGLLKSASRLATNGATVSVVRYEHDPFGRVSAVEETAPSGQPRRTGYAYDAAGNVTNETVTADGISRVTSSEYDAMGRRVRTIRPDGGVVRSEYEPGGRLRSMSGAGVYPVRYGYDEAGRLDRLETFRAGTNGVPDVTRWLYDEQTGRLVAKVYADGATNRYEYRGDGALERRTGARGVSTEYRYDAAGSLTNIAYTDATPPVAFKLDRLGRTVEVLDAAGVHAIRYAPDGQVAAEEWPLSGAETAFEYDVLGRRTGLILRDLGAGPERYRVDYRYDGAGRLGVVSNAGWSAGYAFGPDGRTVSSLTYRTGGVETVRGAWRRDGFGLVTNLAWTLGGQVVDAFAYQCNAVGQRTRCTRSDGTRWGYGYDGFDQVTTAGQAGSNGAAMASREYVYDTIGNRRGATADGKRTAYEANVLNQYERVRSYPAPRGGQGTVIIVAGKDWAPPPSGVETVQLRYDADGNLLDDGRWAYAWDAENRLVAISNETCRILYAYDYLSRRITKSVFTNSSILIQRSSFVYDGWNLISESAVCGLWTNVSRYVWGLDLSGTPQGAGGIGGLISSITHQPSTMNHFLYDANGNVVALLDANGALVASYSYDPFGNLLATINHQPSTIPPNPFRFSTKYQDSEPDLCYYGYRYYSPSLGRWLSRDPIEEEGGRNLYGFVGNDAIQGADYLGREGLLGGVGNCVGAGIDLAGDMAGALIGIPGGVIGELTSVITLEKFQSRGRSPVNPAQQGQCAFLLTISGMGNASDDNLNFGSEIMEAFPSMKAFIGARYWGYANNPALLAGLASKEHAWSAFPGVVQSVLKLPADELGAARIPSRTAASYLEEAYSKAKKNGCCNIDILVAVHSQGGRVLANAIRFLPGNVKKTMRILTLNAEYAFADNGEFAWVRNYKQKGFDIASSSTAWQPARWSSKVKIEEISGVSTHERAAFMGIISGIADGFIPKR